MRIAERLLSRLDGVRQTGQARWLARCPAHDDATPSLAIREVDDRVLVHDFGGCSVHEVLSAVGLELGDLFPEKRGPVEGKRPLSRPFPAADVLRALAGESSFLAVCAADLAGGEQLNAGDLQRLAMSAGRFRAALAAAGVTHA